MIHFAGGNCYSYQFIKDYLINYEFIPLELPGRGKRIDETLLTSYRLASNDIYEQIAAKRNGYEYAIFGHSMGARIALTVTKMLENENIGPCSLFVSGNPGPGAHEIKCRYKLPRHEFLNELSLLGGFPIALLDSQEIINFYEPVLRADFELIEGNKIDDVSAVESPICAFMGNEEESADRISNWATFTKKSFRSEVLEGDHFFIFKHPQRIAELIITQLESV